MIALVFGALRARWAQSVTVLLLTAFAVLAAVAGPAYLGWADARVTRNELAHATAYQQAVETRRTLDMAKARDTSFSSGMPGLLAGGGLTSIFAAEFDVYVAGPGGTGIQRLVYRDGMCARLTMPVGRCPMGVGEVVVGQRTADALGIHSGQTLTSRAVIQTPDGPTATGPTATLTVVGIYRVPRPNAPYWADQHYFDPVSNSELPESIFTSAGTIATLTHPTEHQFVDAVLDPAALRPERLAALGARITDLKNRSANGEISTHLSTGIPDLLARIHADQTALRAVLPLAAVPLVLLALLALFLAVGRTAATRRPDQSLIALRGLHQAPRWWLAYGPAVLPVLLGAALVGVIGAIVGVTAWPALGLTTLGALAVAVLAARRQLTGTVTDLLRQASSRRAWWRGLVVEAVAVALAAASVLQARTGSGPPSGLALLAPGLLLLATALVSARLVPPVAGLVGRWALGAGRLGPALGALHLARRPDTARLLALLVVAIGQLGYAVTATDVATQARVTQVEVELGAAQVLSVLPVPDGRLLSAVRAADPTGRYAMAVANIRPLNPADPPLLAVDSTRLAAVATWRPEFGASTAAEVAAKLHPAQPDPILVHGRGLVVTATFENIAQGYPMWLVAHLAPVDGSLPTDANLGQLRSGRHEYAGPTPGCQSGCRIIGLELSVPPGGGFTLAGTLHSMAQTGPDALISAGLDQAGRWRVPTPTGPGAVPMIAVRSTGLTVSLNDQGLGDDPWLLPADVPDPLPVVSTVPLPRTNLRGLGTKAQPMADAGRMAVLPQVGRAGGLIDLEYALRAARDPGTADNPQVWLAADAPAGIRDALRAQGLTVLSAQTGRDELTYLNGQGPAVGLDFHLLAAGLAMLLAAAGLLLLVAADHGWRHAAGGLSALRVQGLSAGASRIAGRFGYAGMVLAALLLGPFAAVIAWLLTGSRLPILVTGDPLVAPVWPRWPVPVLAWVAAGVLLTVTALVGSLRRGRP